MALILSNEKVVENIYELKVVYEGIVNAGQFFMLKVSEQTFLPRPISVHDKTSEMISFLYQVKGRGTHLLSEKKSGEDIILNKPLGNGFEFFDIDSTFVAGGIGLAPLYLALKEFKLLYPKRKATVYLGFSELGYKISQFDDISDDLIVDLGGIITDKVESKEDEIYYCCGPEVMMRSLFDKMSDNNIYASFERRMGCGVGACFSCSIKTIDGMKRVCCDGPVFKAKEVFYE